MNITLEPYPAAKAPRNRWTLRVEFMYGDADGDTIEEYTFKKQEEFEKVLSFFKKCIAFKQDLHNLFIDMWDRGESKTSLIEDLIEQSNKHYNADSKDRFLVTIEKVKEFYGDFNSMYDILEDLEIETPHDVTCEDCSASIRYITDMFYHDADGNKFKVVLT